MAKAKTNIAEDFTSTVVRVNIAFRQFLQQKLKQHEVDLTFEMLQVLAVLWNKDGINQQEIANITFKDKASMTYLIDNLTKRDLVYRQEDASDRRNKLIFLTKQGKAFRKKFRPWIEEMHATARLSLTDAEVKYGMDILQKVTQNLNNAIE